MRLIATLLLASFLLTGPSIAQANANYKQLPVLTKKFPIAHAGIMSTNQETRKIIQCLALNVYFEARGTIPQDQIGVAYVTKNRAGSGKFEPTICGTVFQIARSGRHIVPQFNWTTHRLPNQIESPAWDKAQDIAYLVYTSQVKDPTKGALYFHDHDDFHGPWQAHSGKLRIGSHVFIK